MFDFGFHFFGNSSGGVVPPPPSTDFIITVKTDNTGTSNDDQFTLPCFLGGYNFTATWDNGDTTTHIGSPGNITFTRPTAGVHTLTISGTFPRIHFNNGGDKLKLIETINFGDVGWTSFGDGNGGSFHGCTNNVININCTGNFDNVVSARAGWYQNSNLSFFPAIDMPICTNILGAWAFCNLPVFPLINLNSVITAGQILTLGAWTGNLFENFPAINMPNCSHFGHAWAQNNLKTFPNVLLGTNATNVLFYGTWRNNDFDYFPPLNLSTGLKFGALNNSNLGAWENCGVIADFQLRNFYGMNDGFGVFNGTTLPTSDYSDILVTQRANNVNTGLSFHGGSSKYNTAGGTARGELVSIQSWSITDGGPE